MFHKDVAAFKGHLAHLSGQSAEEQVERHYLSTGAICLARRWRGTAGEIDLIFQAQDDVIFVEVKSSRSNGRALEMLSRRQVRRLLSTAEEFLATQPKGSLTPTRFDVATTDAMGQIEIVENAVSVW